MIPIIEVITAVDGAPEVTFYESGTIVLEGESRPEDGLTFYNDLLERTLQKKLRKVNVEFNLDYVSSSSTICIIRYMKGLIKNYDQDVKFVWRFESVDEDMQELGEIISHEHHIPLEIKAL